MALGRVPTRFAHTAFVRRMLDKQSEMNAKSIQAATGQKSSDYIGLGNESYRLINMENELIRTQAHIDANVVAKIKIENMESSIDGIREALDNARSKIMDFYVRDLEGLTPNYTDYVGTIYGSAEETGDVTIDSVANTITAVNDNAFENVEPGSNIRIRGSALANDGVYTVQSIDQNGRRITLDPVTPLTADEVIVDGAGFELDRTKSDLLKTQERQDIEEMQEWAFNAMKEMEFFLNHRVNNSYLFSGGKSMLPAVDFPYTTLEDFQKDYDGQNVTFPTTRGAHLSNFTLTGDQLGDLDFEHVLSPPGNLDEGTITSTVAEAFVFDSVPGSTGTTGSVSFDSVRNTVKAQKEGAFSNMSAGDSVVIGGANAGANAGIAYVDRVSDDGRTLFIETSTPLGADATIANGTDLTFGRTYPIGSTFTVDNVDPTLNKTYTVLGVGNGGQQLTVKTEAGSFPPNAAPVTYPNDTTWRFSSDSYYAGDHLEIEHRINDTREIRLGVNAEDPAFEKIFRALGIIAQGNLVDERNPYDGTLASPIEEDRQITRLDKSLLLLEDAMTHDVRNSTELDSDIQSLQFKMSLNLTITEEAMFDQENFTSFLDIRIGNIKEVDIIETVSSLQSDAQTLEISYAALGRMSQMSLINYI